MFSQASVILSMGGGMRGGGYVSFLLSTGGCVWQRGDMCGKGGMHGTGGGGVLGEGGHAWQRGTCVAMGVRGRGHAWWGACVAGQMATAADGMHPTGMHS